MSVILTLLAALIASGACAYHRTGLRTWAIATGVTTLVVGLLAGAPVTTVVLLIIEAAIAVPLLMPAFRRRQISAPLLKIFAKVTPKLSDTEQTALEAGTVGFEGELFSGKPDWHQLLSQPKPELSVEEQAFLDGPVEQLCAMIDDWQITHELGDLPPAVWEFIKKN
ncbi:MAG: acyl-CoA dehydrogenase, partial [Dyella sp.]